MIAKNGDTPVTFVPAGPNICNGCKGGGWVETSDREPKVCPLCKGEGVKQGKLVWDEMFPEYKPGKRARRHWPVGRPTVFD